MESKIKDWLESQIENFPERASGEDFFKFMIRQAGKVYETQRADLIDTLREWLQVRTSPRTPLAVDIASFYNLHELIPDIVDLRNAVRRGEAFKPYYENTITKALEKIMGPN